MHPVVAAALAQRTADVPAGRHGDLRAESTESGLGWPGDPTTHEGLGWPGGTTQQVAVATPPVEPQRRRGWRRLFRAA
ncbi:hypothetical protein [Geodermatophilus sp. URMC 65]